jgi:hypothetical protein
MRIHAKHHLTALSLAALVAFPVWARAHGDSAEVTVESPTTIAGKQLKPGTYKLQVEPDKNHVKVVDTLSGKSVAEVPCQLIQLKSPSNTTEVIVSNNQVTQIDFRNKTQAIKLD